MAQLSLLILAYRTQLPTLLSSSHKTTQNVHTAELRAGCNQERKSGRAPPPRLTATQRKIVERLQEAHGDDFDVRGTRGGLLSFVPYAGLTYETIWPMLWVPQRPPLLGIRYKT